MRQLATIISGLFMCLGGAASAADCQQELRQHLRTDLSLSYKDFDQTPGKGFRLLANLGCSKEAADLILIYMQKNRDYTSSLTWHASQMRALHGDYVVAAQYARMTLKEKEDFAREPLRWNDYVQATIAFLERDSARLKQHRDKVAEGREQYWGNALNLKLLDKLIANFDKSYKDAGES